MIRNACVIVVAIVLFVDAQSGWGQQQYLYKPTPVDAETKVQGKDGILVQDVAVRKGDSLYRISRRFSGHGSYYPQILLFNDIKNPNRIYPGNVFKVPVSRHAKAGHAAQVSVEKEKAVERQSELKVPQGADAASSQKPVIAAPAVTSAAEMSTQDAKKIDAGGTLKKRGVREKTAGSAKKQVTAPAAAATSASGQKLFENAVKAYRQDDCRTALELFDKFLAENQTSPLAADASLYKADCYLKLSAQN